MGQPYVGEIILVPYNFAPAGWAFCDGQLLSIAENTTLFQLIGVTYGGDGQTTFALPDLRGRIPIAQGQGPGLQNYTLGQAGGAEMTGLTLTQLGSHTHPVPNGTLTAAEKCTSGPGNQSTPVGNVYAAEAAGATMPYSSVAPDGTMSGDPIAITGTTTQAGGNLAHANMQPYLTLNFCISLFGVFPSPV